MSEAESTQQTNPLPEQQGYGIVLVGSFNPPIFHPAWFRERGLIAPELEDDSSVEIVRPEAAVMKLGPFELNCNRERFQLQIHDPAEHGPVRDLALGVLSLLPETPVWAVGMNYWAHFRAADLDRWNELGWRLAPRQFWTDLLLDPGMRTVAILGNRDDGRHGNVLAQVEPSVHVRPGVFVSVNDHVQTFAENRLSSQDDVTPKDPLELADTKEIATVLRDCWDQAKERADRISSKVAAQL